MIGVLAAGILAAALVLRRVPPDRATSPIARMLRAVRDDVRCGLLVRCAWPGVVVIAASLPGAVVLMVVAGRRGDARSVPSPSMLPQTAEKDPAHG